MVRYSRTKILLVEDVDDLGRSGDLVAVRPGYARNFLFPSKLAMLADKRTLRMQARLQEERKKKAIVEKKESEEIATRIEGQTLITEVKVDHEGHMYGSVSSIDILHLIEKQFNLSLEKRAIQLKHPLKEIGVHPISLKFKEGVTASITLKIVSEEQAKEESKSKE